MIKALAEILSSAKLSIQLWFIASRSTWVTENAPEVVLQALHQEWRYNQLKARSLSITWAGVM